MTPAGSGENSGKEVQAEMRQGVSHTRINFKVNIIKVQETFQTKVAGITFELEREIRRNKQPTGRRNQGDGAVASEKYACHM